jgi:hypothetical protein
MVIFRPEQQQKPERPGAAAPRGRRAFRDFKPALLYLLFMRALPLMQVSVSRSERHRARLRRR